MQAALEAYEVDVDDQVARWRLDGFTAIGFTVQQAEVLVTTKDERGFFLYPDDVKRDLLDKGCPVDVAFDLLT